MQLMNRFHHVLFVGCDGTLLGLLHILRQLKTQTAQAASHALLCFAVVCAMESDQRKILEGLQPLFESLDMESAKRKLLGIADQVIPT